MNNLMITSSPHFRGPSTTRTIMRDVLVALMPALIASVIFFGVRSLLVVATCVIACVLLEYIYRRAMGLPQTVGDLSAAVTGLLLAFNLPVGIPPWMAVIGSAAAIIVVKQLFGGMGKNFANPAIVGRIVLLISFATPMTTWALPKFVDATSAATSATVDATTGATPLAMAWLTDASVQAPSYMDMFLGNIGGCLGETSALALLLGGVYLVIRKVITATTPLAFIATVFVLGQFLGGDGLFHILAGGVMLGAIFMATDYVTSPTTERGKIVFGIGCGLITMVIRLYASYPEGVSFAILFMNILTPHIDRLTTIKAFGGAPAK